MPERATVVASPRRRHGGEAPLLAVRDLNAWYDESHILHGVDFDVQAGEVVTLLGRNGAGKTTTLKSVMGIVARRTGSVRFGGRELIDRASNAIARLGIAFCPEERGIFASLNVQENLVLPPVVAPGGLSLERIFDLFPNLQERLRSQGTKLSGGEQQMLAIARILRTGARLLLLDEPTEGLAPVIVQQIGATIRRLKDEGFTILLVEQNFRFAATLADRHYVMERGRVVDVDPEHARSRPAWTSCTTTSGCEPRSDPLIKPEERTKNMGTRSCIALVALFLLAGTARGPDLGRRHQDRCPQRPVGHLRRPGRAGVRRGRPHGRRGLRRREEGHEGRGRGGGPSEQARRGLADRPAVVRRGQGGPDHGRADVFGRAGGQPDRPRKEQGADRLHRAPRRT